jgi:glycosyltransferase involved in cell wall biosynthesis
LKTKALFISIDGIADPLGQSQILPYLIGLSSSGFEISIVSAEKKLNLSKNLSQIKSKIQENNIAWEFISYRNSIPLLSQALNFFSLLFLVKKLFRKNDYQIIHCRSYIPALIGLYLKKKSNIKLIFDMRGFWADERLDGKIWSLNNPIHTALYRFFKIKEKQLFESADAIVSLTQTAKDYIINSFQIEENKICVIPCCVDTDLFSLKEVKSSEQERIRKNLGIDDTNFVLSYLGSIGTWYLLKEMLLFFKSLLTQYSNAKFLIITQDSSVMILKEVSNLNIDVSKIIITSAQRTGIPLLVSLSTLSIIFIKPVFSKIASSPTKLGEIMSLGIPVIANAGVGDMKNVLNSEIGGILISDFSNETYEKAIENIPEVLKIQPNAIRSAAKKLFSLNKGVEKYCEIYKNLS